MGNYVGWNLPILVVRQTETQLELSTRWHPEIVLSLMPVMGIIFHVSMLTVSWTKLSCNRNQNNLNCQLTEFKLIGNIKIRDIPLEQLQKATVESKMYDNKINTPYKVHRVMLWTSEGFEPLTPDFTTDWAGVRDDKAKINDFIGKLQQASLKIEPDFWNYQHEVNDIFNWIYGLAFILLTFLFCKPRVFCNFDKGSGRFLIKNAIDGEIKFEGYISEIRDVFVEEDPDDGQFRVSILLDHGSIQPLIDTYSPGTKGKQKAVAKIRQFLEFTPRKNSQYIKRFSGIYGSWYTPLIVERQTDSELVLRTKLNRWWLIISLIFIVSSCSIATARSKRLTCSRFEFERANCKLAEFKMMGQLKTREISLSPLRGATIEIETRQGEDRSYKIYHILLSYPQGFERLTPNQLTAIATAAKINNFIKNSQQLYLEIETHFMEKDSFGRGIFGFLFGAFNLFMLGCDPRLECKFNKTTDRAIIKQDRSFLSKKQNFECSIGEIEDIFLEQYEGLAVCFRISLRLRNGKVKPFFEMYSSDLKSKQKTVEIIRSFLELSSNTGAEDGSPNYR